MRASRSVVLAAVLVACAGLGGCSGERRDWRSAEAADTVEAYGDFLGKHPEGELAAKARQRRDQLVEERDWQAAGTSDTLEAYQQFLGRHPQGKWAEEARIRIESFSVAEPPPGSVTMPGERATVEAPVAEVAATAKPAPAPIGAAPPARDAPKPVASTPMPRAAGMRPARQIPRTLGPAPAEGGFGVQLGAFSDEAKARAEWQRLSGRFPRELGALTPRYAGAQTSVGKLVRLQVGVTDEARARSLCGTLKGAGQGCVVVLPVRR